MAQALKFNPMVDPVSFSPKPFVRGAKDKGSMLSTLAGLGELTAEGISAYQEQTAYEQLDKELGALNEQYLQGSPTVAQDVASSAAADELFMKNMPAMAGFETGEQIEQTYSQVEKAFNEKISYLERAQTQGRISPDQFALRAKEITRGVVARNPHLSRELLGRLSQNLSMSGIQERMDLDQAFVKSQQDAYNDQVKRVTQELKDRDIPMGPFMVNGNLDINSAQTYIDVVRRDQFAYNEAKRAAESGEMMSKQQALELINSGGHVVIANGFIADTRSGLSTILNSGTDYNSQVTQMDLFIDNKIGELSQMFASVSNDPTIRQTIEDTKKRMVDLKTTIKASQSGENLREQLENQNAVTTIIEKNNLRAQVGNLERLDLLQKFSSSPFIGPLLRQNQSGLITDILGKLSKMEEGVRLGPSYFAPVPGTNQSAVELGFDLTAKALNDGNADVAKMIDTNTSDRVDYINNSQDLDVKFTESQKYITQLGNPEYANAVTSLSTETKTKSLELIANQSQVLARGLQTLSEREGVSWSFTSDGELRADGISRQETADFVSRTNANLKAYAALTGQSTKSASKAFFGQLYSNVFKAEDLPDVEASYKSRAEALIPRLKEVESSGRMYETVTDPITGARVERLTLGPVTRSGERAEGAYQLMPSTQRRPGFGVKPVDFTKTGKAFETEMKRFATDYLTAMIKEFDGDEQKALAAYNAGPEAVKKAVQKAAADGKPEAWISKLPSETKNYVKQFDIPVAKAESKLGGIVSNLRKEQDKIRTANPEQYNRIFGNGSSVELAKDIAEEMAQNYGMSPTWQEIHKYMEDNNLMPEVTQRTSTGRVKRASNG